MRSFRGFLLALLLSLTGPSAALADAFSSTPPPVAATGNINQFLNGTNHFSVPSGAGSTGNVVGSGVTVVGHSACWASVDAIQLIDCGVVPGTLTAVSVVSANGFGGSSSGGATPALTISTSCNGLCKGNGTALSTATAGTDYLTPTGNGSGLTALNATQLTSGTVPAARLPVPSASTLGGIQSTVGATHQWISSISTLGVPGLSQPAFADIASTPTTLAGYGITDGVVLNGAGGTPTSITLTNATGVPIEIDLFYSGVPGNSAHLNKVFSRSTVVAAGAPIKCSAQEGATSSATATFFHVVSGTPTSVGTAAFSSSGSAYQGCTATWSGSVSFAAGDALTAVFPASADATLGDIAISIPAAQ